MRQMIFIFSEDATLHVVAGIEAVRCMCEPIDVESSVFAFYDERGRALVPRFTKPNRQRQILGPLSTLTQGEYTLDVADPSSQDPINVALEETSALEPNPWFDDLAAVRRYLTEIGAL